jgi:hypothetical protein
MIYFGTWGQMHSEVRKQKIRQTMRSKYAKLTDEQVQEMRRLFSLGASQSALGRKFGVSATQARNIVLKRQWKA